MRSARRILFLLLATCSAGAQSSQDLHSRYGQPDVERFVVRPEITANVEYGTDSLACQIVIDKQRPLIAKENSITYMRPELVTEIIDELVPANIRGLKLGAGNADTGCAHEDIFYYSNVLITRASDQCVPLKPERESQARIAFRRPACPTVPPPFKSQ